MSQALATEDATDLADARQLLAEVERSRAAARLQAAESAVENKDLSKALSLVQAFLADPGAQNKDRAKCLQGELELAASTTKARELLQQLPDEILAGFAAGGNLQALDQVEAGPLREVFAANLRAQLPKKQQRRTDLRLAREEAARLAKAEQEKRQARIQATPAFQGLMSFVNVHRQANKDADPRLLEYLMKELNITNPTDQKKALPT